MEPQPQRFNEADVLRELEHLQQAIQAARGERRQALERFESFIRDSKAQQVSDRTAAASASFNVPPVQPLPPRPPVAARPPAMEPAGVPPGQPRPAVPPSPPADVPPAAPSAASAASALPPPAPAAFPIVSASVPDAIPPSPLGVPEHVQTSPLRVAYGRPTSRFGMMAALGGLLLAVVIGYVLMRGNGQPVEPAGPPARAQQTPAPAPAAPPAAEAAAPQALPPQTTALRVEFVTDRPVWMRVIVDGQKVAEREFPAGRTLTYDADQAVVVRAGDAGAVRVRVNGADQGTVGVTGQPVTRVFAPR